MMKMKYTYSAFFAATAWLMLLMATPAYAVCTNPAGAGGDIIYNGDENVMSYCDDTNWIALRGTVKHSDIVIPTADLAGHWPLDETSGSIITDVTGNGHNGTWIDGSGNDVAEETTAGLVNTALDFDGTDDYIEAADIGSDILDLQTGEAITVSVWVRATGITNAAAIVQKSREDGWLIRWDNTVNGRIEGCVDLLPSGLCATSNTTLDDGQWHHIVYVMDDITNEMALWVDGVKQTDTDVVNPGGNNADPLRIGRGDPTYHDGLIDDVRIYTRALSADEIGNLYAATGGKDLGLVGHWTLDETAGTTAADSSSSGNNGTMIGGLDATNDSASGKINTSLQFDGVDDTINLGSPAELDNLDSTMTLAAWINLPNGTGGGINDVLKTYQNSSRTAQLRILAGGSAGFWFRDSDGDVVSASGGNVADARWHHVAAIRDGADFRMYVDGVEVASANDPTIAADVTNAGSSWYIGSGQNAENYFDGFIDDVRMYNRALSASEIQLLASACNEGNMIYNADHMVPQYCAGNDTWVAMGPVRDGIDSGLIGHWTLNETAGTTATDSTVNANNGTMAGGMDAATDTVPGKVGTALDFDGTDDDIHITDPGTGSILDIDNGEEISISAWIYPRALTGFVSILNKGTAAGTISNYGLQTDNQQLNFFYHNSTWHEYRTDSNVFPNANQWYHVTVTHTLGTASAIKLYVNGQEESGTWWGGSGDTPVLMNDEDLVIGSYNTIEHWDGYIDDVRMYNRIISPAEVMALYELGNDNDSSLVGHWPLDEMSGTTVTEQITGATGTWSGSVEVQSVPGMVGSAMLFDGVDDMIDFGDIMNADFNTLPVTIAAWVAPQDTGWDKPVFTSDRFTSTGDRQGFKFIAPRDRVTVEYYPCALNNSTCRRSKSRTGLSYADNEWIHVTAVMVDHADIRLYVNGVDVGGSYSGGNGTANIRRSTGPLRIGNWFEAGGAGDQFFNGRIDDLRLYNRALSVTEIDALYKLGIGHCTNPVGKAGDLIFNDDAPVKALQYCDGINWQTSGKSP